MRNKSTILIAILLLVAVPVIAKATVFQQMSYQGVLTDTTGHLIEGPKTICFKIYNASSGGSALWGEECHSINIQQGIVNVILGSINPINLDGSQQYWLGIRISGDSEMSPRIKLTTVPYSINADRLDGYEASAFYIKTQADDHTQNNIDANVWDDHNWGDVYPNADQLDGNHASAFASTNHNHDPAYVNEGQQNSITSYMIDNYTIQTEDLSASISIPNADKWDGHHWGEIYPNADQVDGYNASNNSGCVPINNGLPNINLNADQLDGNHASAFAIASHNHDPQYVNVGEPNSVTTGMIVDLNVGNSDLANNSVTSEKIQDGTIQTGDLSGSIQIPNADKVDGYHASSTPTGNYLYPLDSESRFALSLSNSTHIIRANNNGSGDGFYANVDGAGARGIYAYADGSGSYGVYGRTTSSSGYGVYGQNTNSGNVGSLGSNSYGVYAYGSPYGVYSYGTSVGLYGGTGSGVGVTGYTNSGYGVYGIKNGGGNYAGYFDGNVRVTGSLSKGSGSFIIDHPLDPANKYLYHSFVESPDMMNIYNGNVITDANGEAMITLPDYFEAINREFRYQLTVIGQFAQAIVDEKVHNNRFTIKTDKPNVEVSWQVTGIRHDPFAEAHRIQVEVQKTGMERGKYLHPREYGVSETLGIDYEKIQDLQTKINTMDTEKR
jgi:hypothetical protein